MTVEERAAEPYDESKVMANIAKAGPNTIAAHLKHLVAPPGITTKKGFLERVADRVDHAATTLEMVARVIDDASGDCDGTGTVPKEDT